MMKKTILTLATLWLLCMPGTAMAADCNAVAAQAAAQQNAQVISARLLDRGGQPTCEVVLLKASSDGPRKRVTVNIPAG